MLFGVLQQSVIVTSSDLVFPNRFCAVFLSFTVRDVITELSGWQVIWCIMTAYLTMKLGEKGQNHPGSANSPHTLLTSICSPNPRFLTDHLQLPYISTYWLLCRMLDRISIKNIMIYMALVTTSYSINCKYVKHSSGLFEVEWLWSLIWFIKSYFIQQSTNNQSKIVSNW